MIRLLFVIIMVVNSLEARSNDAISIKNGYSKIYTNVNHKIIEGKFDKVEGHLYVDSKKDLNFDLNLKVDSLNFKQKKDTALFKSEVFFDVQSYSDITIKAQNLVLKETNSHMQVFTGEVAIKVKNKIENIKTSVTLEQSEKKCLLRFPLEVKDRTKKLGLKFNSKKFSSEVELGENIIDDKISFSFSLKCN